MAETNQEVDSRPLVKESSTAESTNVEVVLGDLADGALVVPDYQRDADQWDDVTKSLFIESVINNLTIPAFFFEVLLEGGLEKNEVVDGQQRLTTLAEYFKNKFRLVESTEAPYLSPMSVHYAKRTYDELPKPYQQAFKKYRLSIIKLRDLGPIRLEVFRRINQGGTPLSGHDIRLAYYGDQSPSLAFVRAVGIYDLSRAAASRILDGIKKQGVEYPWAKEPLETWKDWWEEKEISRGQAASEMFLWSHVAANVEPIDTLLQNSDALSVLKCRFTGGIDEALDAAAAQLQYQDKHPEQASLTTPFQDLSGPYFKHFQGWVHRLLSREAVSLPVSKHRMVGAVVGAAYRLGKGPDELSNAQWTSVVEFIRRPAECAKKQKQEWPLGRGRWDGEKGYREQFRKTHAILTKLLA